MAKNCIVCNKNLGMLSVKFQLLDDKELFICSECFDKMPPIINELYQKRIYPTKTELLESKEDVLQRLKLLNCNQDTINVIAKFFDDKIVRAKITESSEDGRVLKKCPICKKNVNYNMKICSECGFAFETVPTIEYEEIAQMYNARLEQYKKNPFYEYDYIVVPNKPDGTTNKERIQEIISSHAMQGWRLITMYSNELGKNSMGVSVAGIGGGTNTTMCEDVMVFERCIKAGE